MTEADELLKKGRELYNQKKYVETIDLLNDTVLQKHREALLYNLRGNAWYKKDEYDQAIADYTVGINIKSDIPTLYYNRGNSLSDKGEKDKAIADYTKAISLKPTYADAFNNRGNAWNDKGQFDLAIADLTQAINLDPKSPEAYYNRGLNWVAKKNIELALRDFEHYILLAPSDPDGYFQRAKIKEEQKHYVEAAQDFRKVLELNPNYGAARKRLEILDDLTKVVKPGDNLLDGKSTEALPEADENLDKVLQFTRELMDSVAEIRFLAQNVTLEYVTHYTKLKVIDIFVMKDTEDPNKKYEFNEEVEPKMRFQNAVHMNDPQEGLILLQYFIDRKRNEGLLIKKYFEAGGKTEGNDIYLGSFLPAPQDEEAKSSHEDDLVMWRTYGKDENGTEGAGCSVVIDAKFFMAVPKSSFRDAKRPLYDHGKQHMQNETDETLLNVFYYDARKGAIVDSEHLGPGTRDKVQGELSTLNLIISNMITWLETSKQEKYRRVIEEQIFWNLSRIRFLFKSADYAYENECRIILYVPTINKEISGNKSTVKIKHAQIDPSDSGLPRKMYVESVQPPVCFIRKLILGPKVSQPNQWLYLEAIIRRKQHKRVENNEFDLFQMQRTKRSYQ